MEKETWRKIIIISLNLGLIGLVAYFFYENRLNFTQMVNTKASLLNMLLVLTILFIYNYFIHKKIFEYLEKRRLYKKKLAEEQQRIRAFLDNKFELCSGDEIEKIIESLNLHLLSKETFKEHQKNIIEHLELAKKAIEKAKYKEEITQLYSEKRDLEDELKKLATQKREENDDEDERKDRIKRNLNFDNNVLLTEELSEEEIEILKEEGYKQKNEYDISAKKIVTALVKQILNHSPTHTFLVWSTMQYIKNNLDVDNLEEHETRDADITFKHKGKYYALEIETGSLLEKPRQLAEKVKYLNQKYHERWMFIVSNKNLVSKYGKFGNSTQRNWVAEKLTKMLENKHPEKSGGKSKTPTTKNKKIHPKTAAV